MLGEGNEEDIDIFQNNGEPGEDEEDEGSCFEDLLPDDGEDLI